METPKELFVVVFNDQGFPTGIKRCPVISYDHKDNSGKIQVTDIYSADEADVETSEGTKHVTLGRDASDELEIALRIALHALDLKTTFLHLEVIGTYQQLVLFDTSATCIEQLYKETNMRVRLQERYDIAKRCADSLFMDACRLQREMRESAQE